MNKHPDHFNYKTLTREELKAFEDNGYLIIKQIITDKGLQQMREESMSAWSAEKESFDPSKSWLHLRC